MKTNHLTVVSLVSALFIGASTFTPSYAVNKDQPPVKQAPTGADCQKQATAAAEKVKANGGTEAQQQAAYSQAKMKCQGKK